MMTAAMSPDKSSNPPVRSIEIKRGYDRPPSFTDLLPWVEYIPESRAFLLEDGVSVGALFELVPVGTEARTDGTSPGKAYSTRSYIGKLVT